MKRLLNCLMLCLLLIVLSSGGSFAASDQANKVLVIFNNHSTYTYDQNANGLQDSYELALFYAAKRDIPLRNLLGVNCTRGNTYYYSGNTSYPTFLSEIDVPVKNKLAQLGEDNIDYFAMIYGIPYQLSYTSDSIRSLDDFIVIPFDIDGMDAGMPSHAYLETSPGIPPDKGHFNHSYKSPYGHNMYLVSRLDGPNVDKIRDQVYGALYGETYLYNSPGYYRGIGYVENRYGSYSDNFSGYPFGYGTYGSADKCMAYAYTFFADKGYPYKREVTGALIGDPNTTFLDGSDASIAEDAILYGGWYSFMTYRDAFRWLPGSVACDLNSNSVSGIRSGAISFGYEAMRDGLTSAVGVINEPYLNGHAMPDVLLYYLLNGYNLAESAWHSIPFFRWRSITIGDPIYTPFAEKTPVIDSSFSRQLTVFDDTVAKYSAEQRKISVYLTEGPVPELAVFRLECWNASGYSNITDYNIDYRFKKEFTLLNLTPDTTYYYKITARDPVGNIMQSPVLSFTTYANNSATIPTLAITRNRMSINASESVGFNSTSNCTDCTYKWSFGDGSEYTGRNTVHSYAQKGVYDVFLHAITDQGVAFTKRSIVYVLDESATPLQNCSQLGGACCSTGQHCQGGQFQPSSDCSACCTGGTCQTSLCGNTQCDSGECNTCPWDCSPAQCCGDGTCQGSENCSSCTKDCLAGGQVCCSGMAYTGTCCSDSECSSPMVCTDHACSEPSQPEQRYPPWLGGYWNFDEGSGTIAHDLSGNGNTGTLNGTNWTTGNISGALQFDGVDDYVEVSNSPSIQFNGQAFSVSAWIKPAATTYASRNIAQKDNMNYGNQFPWQLYHYGTGIYFKVRDNSTTRQVVVSSGVGTSAYSHIAATFDPAGNMSLYINGQEKASLNISGFTFDNSSGTYPLRIGAMSYTSGFYFNGTIDEVLILNLTLSPEQVNSIYTQGAAGGYFAYARSCRKSDPDCNGCVDGTELTAFIGLWKADSSNPTLKELMEAIGYWKRGGCP